MQCPLGFHLQAVTTPANPQTDVSGTRNEQKQQEVGKKRAAPRGLLVHHSVLCEKRLHVVVVFF